VITLKTSRIQRPEKTKEQRTAQTDAGNERAGLLVSQRDVPTSRGPPSARPRTRICVGVAFIHKDQLAHRSAPEVPASALFFRHVGPVFVRRRTEFFYTANQLPSQIDGEVRKGRSRRAPNWQCGVGLLGQQPWSRRFVFGQQRLTATPMSLWPKRAALPKLLATRPPPPHKPQELRNLPGALARS